MFVVNALSYAFNGAEGDEDAVNNVGLHTSATEPPSSEGTKGRKKKNKKKKKKKAGPATPPLPTDGQVGKKREEDSKRIKVYIFPINCWTRLISSRCLV